MSILRNPIIPLRLKKIAASEPVPLREFLPKVSFLYSWLYPELRPYRKLAIGSWVLGALSGVVSASPIIIARKIVEDFQNPTRNVVIPLVLLAAAILAMGLLRFLSSLSVGLINFRLRHSLELKFARHIANTPLSYYENNTSGKISLAPFMQIPFLTSSVELIFKNFLQAGVTILILLGVLFYTNFFVGVLCVFLVPCFFFGMNYLGRRVQKSVARTFQQISDLHSHFLESLISVKSIRALGISDKRIAASSRIVSETMRDEFKTLLFTGSQGFLLEAVFAGGVIVLLLLLHHQFIRGHMTLSLSVAALTGFGLLAREVKNLVTGITVLRRIVGACSEVIGFLQQSPDTVFTGTEDGPEEVREIRLLNVEFSYGRGMQVLRGVDMVFPRGRITGIIGDSGAGKSTVADILLRLRTAQGGQILLNGIDFSRFKESWIRGAFGFVDQEPYLFNATIRENLLLAAPESSEDDMVSSLTAASALGFVAALPQGLDTTVGEGGSLLSVGEKQRLALARALMKKPSVLVLDEITSSVDPQNELIILEALRELTPTMVVISISHKQSVADFCDGIYRLDGGKATIIKGEMTG